MTSWGLGGDVGNHQNVTRSASGEDLGPGYASVVIGVGENFGV
jgi:hypothetical protein